MDFGLNIILRRTRLVGDSRQSLDMLSYRLLLEEAEVLQERRHAIYPEERSVQSSCLIFSQSQRMMFFTIADWGRISGHKLNRGYNEALYANPIPLSTGYMHWK